MFDCKEHILHVLNFTRNQIFCIFADHIPQKNTQTRIGIAFEANVLLQPENNCFD